MTFKRTSAPLLLLAIPLVAMQFTDQVNWDLADFVIMGVLLIITSLAYQLASNGIKNNKLRILVSAFIILAFLLVWAELAVGVFGTPFAGS